MPSVVAISVRREGVCHKSVISARVGHKYKDKYKYKYMSVISPRVSHSWCMRVLSLLLIMMMLVMMIDVGCDFYNGYRVDDDDRECDDDDSKDNDMSPL